MSKKNKMMIVGNLILSLNSFLIIKEKEIIIEIIIKLLNYKNLIIFSNSNIVKMRN
jgi:hypothetical protein